MIFDGADMITGLVLGILWTKMYYKPVLPVKVTVIPAVAAPPSLQWEECVEGLVVKCSAASHFGSTLTFNPTGADALGHLLQDMAVKLDTAVANSWADGPTYRMKVNAQFRGTKA